VADGPTAALQKAVVAALKAHPGVHQITGGRVFGKHVPQETALPYVKVTRFEPAPWDTQATEGHEITFSVRAYTRTHASVQLRNLTDAVVAALHRRQDALSVEGHALVELQYLAADEGDTEDGKTHEQRMAFMALLDSETD